MADAGSWEMFRFQPGADALTQTSVDATYVDIGGMAAFWRQWYLDDFIGAGLGKVKFLFGGPGSGKTHFLRRLGSMASSLGYFATVIDARVTRLAAIDDAYRAIAREVPWEDWIAQACQRIVVEELGYPEFPGSPANFLSWVESVRGLEPVLVRRDVREAVDRWLKPQDLDPGFLLAMRSWLNQALLGEPDDGIARSWCVGEKLTASQRKSLGVTSNLHRRNARAVLASLASWSHHVGGQGMVVGIDHAEVWARTDRVDGHLYYTRGNRDQAYEMIRQLVDESVHIPYLMMVIAGERAELSDPRSGFPSYPALWARIENEIVANRVNRWGDSIDLDQLWADDREQVAVLQDRWTEVPVTFQTMASAQTESPGKGLEWSMARRLVADALARRRDHLEGERL